MVRYMTSDWYDHYYRIGEEIVELSHRIHDDSDVRSDIVYDVLADIKSFYEFNESKVGETIYKLIVGAIDEVPVNKLKALLNIWGAVLGACSPGGCKTYHAIHDLVSDMLCAVGYWQSVSRETANDWVLLFREHVMKVSNDNIKQLIDCYPSMVSMIMGTYAHCCDKPCVSAGEVYKAIVRLASCSVPDDSFKLSFGDTWLVDSTINNMED